MRRNMHIKIMMNSGEDESFVDLPLGVLQLFHLHICFHLRGYGRLFNLVSKDVFLLALTQRWPARKIFADLFAFEHELGKRVTAMSAGSVAGN